VAELNLERTRDFVSLQVTEASYWLEEAVARVNLTQSSLFNADENLAVITDRYDEGLTSILAVLDAQFTWQQAYSDHIDAKLNYLISYSGFKRALGELTVE
jgi:outer membrane protein